MRHSTSSLHSREYPFQGLVCIRFSPCTPGLQGSMPCLFDLFHLFLQSPGFLLPPGNHWQAFRVGFLRQEISHGYWRRTRQPGF